MTAKPLQLWPMMRRVERAAFTQLTRCARLRGLKELPLPIPVEEWVEAPLGIRLGVADLRHLGEQVLGAAFVQNNEILVSQSLADDNARFRFTVAHELGHLCLHRKIAPVFHELADDAPFVERRVEREADRFAASFLMPIELLCREFAACADREGIAAGALIHELHTGEVSAVRLFRSRFVPQLARRFGMSASATLIRFADVQLPTGEAVLPQRTLRPILAELVASKTR